MRLARTRTSKSNNNKMAAHAASCRSIGVSFIPLIVKTLGGRHDQALETIRGIGRSQGQRLDSHQLSLPPTVFRDLQAASGGGMLLCG